MHADPKQVAARRWKRRLKAAGSLALAALAGAFVACQRGVQSFQEATAPAITPAPEKGDAATDTTGLASPAPLLADARADSLAVVPSPSARDAGADAYVMDAKEHRKGLPVPDYIVE
jgi:hypothetical protein